MQALGVIETRGLIAAIESADVMLKVANVNLLEKTYVGGGIVYIAVSGDIGAVKASVEAGAEAVRKMGDNLLISKHTIPRPNNELNKIITPIEIESNEIELKEVNESNKVDNLDENIQIETIDLNQTVKEEIVEEEIVDSELDKKDIVLSDTIYKEIKKENLDKIIIIEGLDNVIENIKKFKVIELRNLAIEYNNFGLSKKQIAKLGKKLLIEEFVKYYTNK